MGKDASEHPSRSDRARTEVLERHADRPTGSEPNGGHERRTAPRYDLRGEVQVEYSIEPTSQSYVGRARDISRTGLAFLQFGYVPPRTRCRLVLPSLDGKEHPVDATVARCQTVEGSVHLVSVRFTTEQDPAVYCSIDAPCH